MATKAKRPKNEIVIIDSLYIFSKEPFPNLENTFDGCIITTQEITTETIPLKDKVAHMFLGSLSYRDEYDFNNVAVVANPSPQAITMAGLSMQEGCYIARLKSREQLIPLGLYMGAICELTEEIFEVIPDMLLDPLAKLCNIEGLGGPDSEVYKLMGKNNDHARQSVLNLRHALLLLWEGFDKEFKINK